MTTASHIAATAGTIRDGLDEAERASRDQIQALQLKRLAWSIRHAYDNVAHFRQRCAAMDVHPDDLRQLSDLQRFPLTVKTDLRDTYPFGLFAVPRERIARLHGSSGTTGKPVVVGYTARDLDMWADVVARSLRAAGVRPGMMVHNAYGYGLFTGGLGAHYGAERLGCAVVPVSGGMTERQVQLIQDFRPDAIMVTPSYMLALLDGFIKAGIDPRQSSLRFGIFGAEPWSNALRVEIEKTFGLDATDIYGLSEVIGPGVAQECVETKDGLHIWEDHFYPEVIDPQTGAVLPDGELGELVFTSLTKEAFPIIRYRTRDLTRLLPGTARPGMRRMEKVTGRSDDMVILRGVNVFPTQIEELLLETSWSSGHYQLELTRPGRMDELTVHAEVRVEEFPSLDTERVAQELARRIKANLGVSTHVALLAPGGLERSLGKARRVVDNRPKDR
ncbi:MAG: phenylacetate--CoA ligase [Rhodospirillales bacterium]|nr:phenylacetate--CoA ligase [Rhodospirillales bacterium]MDE2200161.1 phenylacetate--CoA ligase [Rhodospirillales bacterium]MDE2576151.1 phenylacetate--CoA ligase [Rhodospirillales bacterium]